MVTFSALILYWSHSGDITP